jgi:glycosyltransferase involved in cell wall biosynthesis
MNILSINTYASGGGAARIAHSLHASLRSHRIQGKMLVGYLDPKNTDKSIVASSPSLLPPDTQFSINNIPSMIVSNDIDRPFFPSFKHREHVEWADIIHCHNLHGNYFSLYLLAEFSRKKPIVWTLQDMWSVTGHCAYSLDCTKWEKGCFECPYLSLYQKFYFDRTSEMWEKKRDIYRNASISVVVPSLWLKNIVAKSS